MINPEIFVPRSALELPREESGEVQLGLIEEADLLIAPIRVASILSLHMSCFPEWQEWSDGTGGTMHIRNRGGDVPLAHFTGDPSNPQLVTPQSTDGYPIHDSEKRILAYGASLPGTLSVVWGVSTQPLEEILGSPDEVTIDLIHSHDTRTLFQAKLNSATPEERKAILADVYPMNHGTE
jgi:hypothetical protein